MSASAGGSTAHGVAVEPSSGPRYPSLDGLRAIAVLCVFMFHLLVASLTLRRHVAGFAQHLDIGVEIFFVLSGFLIYRPFAAAHLLPRAVSELRAYARRRVLRIFPAYLVALLVLWKLGEIWITDRMGLLKHALLIQTYFRDRGGPGLGVSWTLVIEVSFYAFVPLWSGLVRRVGRRHPLPAELVGAVLLVVGGYVAFVWTTVAASAYDPWGVPVFLTVLPPALPSLGSGMLLAILTVAAQGDHPGARRLVERVGRHPGLWWCIAGALYWLLATQLVDDSVTLFNLVRDDRDRIVSGTFQIVVAAILALPAVTHSTRPSRVRRFLSWRPLAYVGLVSYSVYLWHLWVLHWIGYERLNSFGPFAAWKAAGWGLVAFAVTLLIATISYFLVERPALELARRPLVDRVRRRPARPPPRQGRR